MLLETDDVKLLVDLGFVGLSHGFVNLSEAIFDAILALRPNEEAGAIGSAMVMISKGENAKAIKLLQSTKPSEAVFTFLGMALSKIGDKDMAREKLESVILNSDSNSMYSDLAKSILQEIDNK